MGRRAIGTPRRRVVAASAAIGVVLAVATGITPGRAADDRISFSGLSPDQIELARWAVDLYERAGLDLPSIDFVRHPSTDACLGRAGITTADATHAEIGICTSEASGAEEILFLHELAHAWDRHALAGERRRAFLELRGLGAWRSDVVPWEEIGAEQAAEVVAWGLIDRPVWIVRIGEISCGELRAGYVVLTGTAPLHGFTDLCDR